MLGSGMPYRDDGIPMSDLWRRGDFITQVLLLFLTVSLAVVGSIWASWPKYCFNNSWAYFFHIGVTYSLTILDSSSLANWIVFEKNNWVYYFAMYSTIGVSFIIASTIFILDYVNGCKEPEAYWPNTIPPEPNYDGFSIELLVVEIFFMLLGTGYLIFSLVYVTLQEALT